MLFQIADFGMTRAANHVFDLNKTEQIPLRWTAPEVCFFQFPQKSFSLDPFQGVQIENIFREK